MTDPHQRVRDAAKALNEAYARAYPAMRAYAAKSGRLHLDDVPAFAAIRDVDAAIAEYQEARAAAREARKK